jgi:NAD(P)-dependent dehydrogenase (short-subunit alcohol dehydrogenase family)
MNRSLHADTVALITGGTQGLGLAVAERLLADGCTRIALVGRDPSKGKAAAKALTAKGADVVFLQVDMGNAQKAGAMIDDAAARFGTVTALVNAAAVTDRASILDCPPEEWDRQFAVNAKGPFFAIQRLAQRAIDSGQKATVVNILSMASHVGQSFLAPYSASKAALSNVTKNAAQALRARGVRINGINCGWMDTPGEDAIQRKWHAGGDDWLARAEAAQPMGMLLKPAHVAGLVSYLLSAQSGVMTGAIIDFDQYVAGSYPE